MCPGCLAQILSQAVDMEAETSSEGGNLRWVGGPVPVHAKGRMSLLLPMQKGRDAPRCLPSVPSAVFFTGGVALVFAVTPPCFPQASFLNPPA